MECIDRMEPEPGGQHPVEGGRGPTSLDVAEHSGPGFLARPGADLDFEELADPSQAGMTEGVDLGLGAGDGPLGGQGSLGGHHDGRVVAGEPVLDEGAHGLDVEGPLGDQDHVGPTGQPRMERDPTGVTPHDLDDEHPVVALGRGVEPVDGLGSDGHRGVEAEGVVGGAKVVVDGLRHPDYGQAGRSQLGGHAEGVLAAYHHQRLHPEALHRLEDPALAVLGGVGIGPARPEDGATPGQDAPDSPDVEGHHVPLERAAPAVPEPDELVAVGLDALADYCPDDGVEPGAVAASGQDSDAHEGDRTEDLGVPADQRGRGEWHTGQVTHGPAAVHQLLADHGLRPSRALGQNFVADPNTVRRIARLAGISAGTPVVEVGSGLGSLTLALAEAGASVTAVEVDRRLVPVLRTQVEPLGVRVVEADALAVDWEDLLSGHSGPWSLVANLPYNVAVPVVIRVLEQAPRISSLLVMVQREVGERLASGPGQRAYGAVSVKVAYWAGASVVGRVPPSVFIPKPRVESVLVRLERHATPAALGASRPGPGDEAYDRLFTVVRAGFGQRRKMLRRSLDGMVAPGAYEATGIPPTARAEELSLEAWEELAAWDPARGDTGSAGAAGTEPGPP